MEHTGKSSISTERKTSNKSSCEPAIAVAFRSNTWRETAFDTSSTTVSTTGLMAATTTVTRSLLSSLGDKRLCYREGERLKVCSFVLSRRPTESLAASRRWSSPSGLGRGGGESILGPGNRTWSYSKEDFWVFQSNVIHVMNLSFKTQMRSSGLEEAFDRPW